MKKFIVSLMTLVLFALISTSAVQADETDTTVTCDEGQKTLVFHLMRNGSRTDGLETDFEYGDEGLWFWGNDAQADYFAPVLGTDEFGAYFNICIGEDATEVGAIPNISTTWDNELKFSHEGENLAIDVTSLFEEDEDGNVSELEEMHVYFIEGSDEVMYVQPDMKYVFVAYADEDSRYDGWGIHTWNTGTNGSSPDWGSPLAPQSSMYNDRDFEIKLFVIEINPDDAEDEIGFIITNASEQTDDIMIDTTDFDQAKMLYFIWGDEEFVDYEGFMEVVKDYIPEPFAFVAYDGAETNASERGTHALDPKAIQVQFNQNIYFNDNFDESNFTLKQGDTVITIDEITYLENDDFTDEFLIRLDSALDHTKEYTLYYDNGLDADDVDVQVAEIKVDLDTEAPTIQIIGSSTIEIKQYSDFEGQFPNFVASDNRDGTITRQVFVPETKGDLDTAVVGEQVITLAVYDSWGHYTELEFTVVVVEADGGNTGLVVGLVTGGVVIIGAVIGFVVVKRPKVA